MPQDHLLGLWFGRPCDRHGLCHNRWFTPRRIAKQLKSSLPISEKHGKRSAAPGWDDKVCMMVAIQINPIDPWPRLAQSSRKQRLSGTIIVDLIDMQMSQALTHILKQSKRCVGLRNPLRVLLPGHSLIDFDDTV